MNYYQSKLQRISQEIDAEQAPKPRYDLPPVDALAPPIPKTLERWTVYMFTLPIKYTKKVALGFESKAAAQRFIKERLSKPQTDQFGNIVPKVIEEDGIEYIVKYDVMRDSLEDIDLYGNDPGITVYGNDKEAVYDKWVG